MNLLELEFGAQGGARLCGPGRTPGDTYVECGLQLGGQPVEAFLVDPPTVIDPDQWNIRAVGVSTLRDAQNVLHILDWVGSEHYPYVTDFVEEARSQGVSRKIPRTVDLSGLSDRSRLLLIHPRGSVSNFKAYQGLPGFHCPCGYGHAAGDDCTGLHWFVTPAFDSGTRPLANGSYPLRGWATLPARPQYQPAVFASFPVTNLSVIRSPDLTAVTQRVTALQGSTRVPVVVKDE